MADIAATAVGQRSVATVANESEIGVYEDFGALHALAPAWDRLARTPTEQSIWAQAWAETLGRGYSLRISTAGPPDNPSAIAPLVWYGSGPPRFELLGSDLNEPADVLGDDEAAAASIARDLARLRAPLLLRRVPAGSPFVAAVVSAYAGSLVVVRPAPGRPYVALDAGWLEPERSFSRMARSDLRDARQRAEALGEVTADMVSPAPDQVGALLDDAPAPLESDAFIRRYAESAARRGILRLCFLLIGGRVGAVQVAVELSNRFWLLRQVHDPALARSMPDKLLMLETIRFAAQKGLTHYELLGGPHAWSDLATEREHGTVSVRTYTPGFSGLRALASDSANLAGRSWRALTSG